MSLRKLGLAYASHYLLITCKAAKQNLLNTPTQTS